MVIASPPPEPEHHKIPPSIPAPLGSADKQLAALDRFLPKETSTKADVAAIPTVSTDLKDSKGLQELIGSADPLSDTAVRAVMEAREENGYVDYKVAFEHDEEQEWLGITKDVMAFANTDGGYLAFGVKNGTFDLIGLDEGTVRVLSDTNNLMLKLNRHVEPEFGALRAKTFEADGKKCVVVFIPPSLGHTHIFSADGAFKQQSGTPKVVYRQGTFYVRRSGANHLADARDLDAVIARRMDYFRETLLGRIARVVNAPPDTEILVVKQKGEEGAHKKFVIENAPDAIAVKGMSFSVSPETTEQEVAACIALTERTNDLPSPGTVWKWYRERKGLQLTEKQRVRVAAYSLLDGAPLFYWLQGCAADEIKPMLLEVLGRRIDAECAGNIVIVAAFLGRKFHKSVISKLGPMAGRLGRRDLEFPSAGPRSLFEVTFTVRKMRGAKNLNAGVETELDEIAASSLITRDSQPELRDRWRACKLDGFLYAQGDRYLPTGEPVTAPGPDDD
jgi:hypothetical protein